MMHHQLSFLVERGSSVTPEAFDAVCSPLLVRSVEGNETCWSYANADTGVSFAVRHAASAVQRPAAHDLDDTGLACEVPYLRPGFFAREAMGVVARLCAELRMTALEPDVGSTPSSSSEDLVALWRRGNLRAVQAAHRLGELPARWPRVSAETWWQYMRDKARLQRKLDDAGVFVPRVFLFVDDARGSLVRTGMAWSDCIATLFPPADLVMVLDKSNEPTASGQDTRLRGLAERDEVVEVLGDLLERVETAAGDVPYLPPERCALARARFRALRVAPPPDPSTFRGTSASACIDDEDASEVFSVS